MQESFSDLVRNQEEKNNVIQCTVIRKFTRGKNEFLKVDAGMKTEGVVNLREFDKEPMPGDKVDLIIVEANGNELTMSFKKVKFEQVLFQLRNLQKNKTKTLVTIKEKTTNGYKVNYEGVYGILNSTALLKDKVEIYIAKVFKDGFYCFTEMKKSRPPVAKSSVVDCEIEKKDNFHAFVKINNQEKLEGIMDIKEIKSDRPIKAQIIYVEGIKAILSTAPIKRLEIKKILQKLQIEHDNFLKVSGIATNIGKESIIVMVGNVPCRVPVRDLFWTSTSYDPKIDINHFIKDEKYDFYIKEMIIHWKAEELKISTEAQYGISTLIEGFKAEIENGLLKVGELTFDILSEKNLQEGTYDFTLDFFQFSLKTASINPYINFEKKYPEGSSAEGTIISDPNNKKEVLVEIDGLVCHLSVFEIDWDFSIAKKQFSSFKAGDKIQVKIKNIDVDKSFVQLSTKSTRGDEFYTILRSLQKGKVYNCRVEEVILNQFKKTKKLKVTLADGEKYEGIFGFIPRIDLSIHKRINVGDIIPVKFIKIYNQEILFSQKAVEQEENARVAKMIEKINEGEGESFSSLEEHFNLL